MDIGWSNMFFTKKDYFYYISIYDIDPLYYVITSIRIPFTTIDLFFTGMCAAYIGTKWNKTVKNKMAVAIP